MSRDDEYVIVPFCEENDFFQIQSAQWWKFLQAVAGYSDAYSAEISCFS